MIFLTLQSKKVIEIAKQYGTYHPDFSFSPKQHQEDYARALSAFNELNGTDCKGLVFCLGPEIFLNSPNYFRSKADVQNLLRGNSSISDSFVCEPYSFF